MKRRTIYGLVGGMALALALSGCPGKTTMADCNATYERCMTRCDRPPAPGVVCVRDCVGSYATCWRRAHVDWKVNDKQRRCLFDCPQECAQRAEACITARASFSGCKSLGKSCVSGCMWNCKYK